MVLVPITQFVPPAASTFASQPSFTQKILTFTITVGQSSPSSQPSGFAGLQGSATPGTYTLSGYRSKVRYTEAAAPNGGQAEIVIYGLSQTVMNQIATLGIANRTLSQNTILIGAGAASNESAAAANANNAPIAGFPVVFGGTIWLASAGYSDMPEVPFRITAQIGMFAANKSVAPTSLPGEASISTIMQNFADQLKIPLENNGVYGSLSNPYFPGTLLQQIYQAAEHSSIRALIVDGGTKLAIMPLSGSRTSALTVPLVSKTTGMIGAPSFAPNGYMTLKMVYTPNVVLFGNIQVQSDDIPQANKLWTVYKLDYALDSLVPDGEWSLTALCYPKGLTAPPPQAVN